MAIGFTRLPDPKAIAQHHLWTLQKPDGRTVRASLRRVPHGVELLILYNGELHWSEVRTDSRAAGELADETRREWEARGWMSADACPRCHGSGWQCEAHPGQPAAHRLEDGAVCGGPGMPCDQPGCSGAGRGAFDRGRARCRTAADDWVGEWEDDDSP